MDGKVDAEEVFYMTQLKVWTWLKYKIHIRIGTYVH